MLIVMLIFNVYSVPLTVDLNKRSFKQSQSVVSFSMINYLVVPSLPATPSLLTLLTQEIIISNPSIVQPLHLLFHSTMAPNKCIVNPARIPGVHAKYPAF